MSRTLLNEVAYRFVNLNERHKRLREVGSDKADDAFGELQNMERSIEVRELNGSWRRGDLDG